jgi:hypothetical protein
MTVRELMFLLSQQDGDALVVLDDSHGQHREIENVREEDFSFGRAISINAQPGILE